MIAFVTGGTSFIGRHLLNCLLKMRLFSEIRLLIRSETPLTDRMKAMDESITLIVGDITNSDGFRQELEDVTHVFHLAALASDRASLQAMIDVNVNGTKSFLEALRKRSKDSLEFFFLMSSTGVYGLNLPKDRPVSEDHPKNPSHPYHVSKWLQEKACWDARQSWQLPLVVFRPPMTLGPGDYKTFPTMLKAVQENKFPIIGNGKNILTIMDVRDLVRAMELAVLNPTRVIGEAFNLHSVQVTLEELHEAVRTVARVTKEPKRYPYWLVYMIASLVEFKDKIFRTTSTLNRYRIQKFAVTRRYDDSKIRTVLGFKPQHDLMTTLNDSWESLSSDNAMRHFFE